MPVFFAIILALTSLFPSAPALAEDTFYSLRYTASNLRSGNSKKHPIVARYERKGLPFLVLDLFKEKKKSDDGKSIKNVVSWIRVKDFEGQTGWFHVSQLSRAPMMMVLPAGNILEVPLLAEPNAARPTALLARYTLVRRKKCADGWCMVEYEDEVHGQLKGYIDQAFLWG